MRNREKAVLLAASTIAIAALIAVSAWYTYGTAETVTVRVVKTERVTTGSGDQVSSKYLVFAVGETFQNSDSIWYGKFNSSDLHGRIDSGTYEMKVYGWRVPFLSMYRNIVDAVQTGG